MNLRDTLVFSDLDGTLLDHEDYSWTAAETALQRLRELEIPLILASSKTAAEIAPLREKMGFSGYEAIVENGAGILPSGKLANKDDRQYRNLLATLGNLPKELKNAFTGFSQWTDEEVSERTGLELETARLARARQFSEPGIWTGSPEDFARFGQLLKAVGIHAQQGGRFVSLSFGTSKADRMCELVRKYEETRPRFSIALGDAPNDITMLETADLGFIIANPSHPGVPELAREKAGTILRSKMIGPSGWNEVMMNFLNRHESGEG